ncbi:MAG TPA: hypothetical protein VIV40_18805 [Kofleriaceae bacterium]
MTRIKDPSAIEARLLELAHTTDAKITAPALAYFAPCSIADAAQVLDDLAARNQLGMEVEDDGTVVYEMYGRQKLGAAPPLLQRAVPRTTALVAPTRVHGASPMLAALLSVFVPGAGHLYAGRFLAAVLWFIVVGAGYALILPGLVLHLFNIASAASAAHRLNAGAQRLQLAAGY